MCIFTLSIFLIEKGLAFLNLGLNFRNLSLKTGSFLTEIRQGKRSLKEEKTIKMRNNFVF